MIPKKLFAISFLLFGGLALTTVSCEKEKEDPKENQEMETQANTRSGEATCYSGPIGYLNAGTFIFYNESELETCIESELLTVYNKVVEIASIEYVNDATNDYMVAYSDDGLLKFGFDVNDPGTGSFSRVFGSGANTPSAVCQRICFPSGEEISASGCLYNKFTKWTCQTPVGEDCECDDLNYITPPPTGPFEP